MSNHDCKVNDLAYNFTGDIFFCFVLSANFSGQTKKKTKKIN